MFDGCSEFLSSFNHTDLVVGVLFEHHFLGIASYSSLIGVFSNITPWRLVGCAVGGCVAERRLDLLIRSWSSVAVSILLR